MSNAGFDDVGVYLVEVFDGGGGVLKHGETWVVREKFGY